MCTHAYICMCVCVCVCVYAYVQTCTYILHKLVKGMSKKKSEKSERTQSFPPPSSLTSLSAESFMIPIYQKNASYMPLSAY